MQVFFLFLFSMLIALGAFGSQIIGLFDNLPVEFRPAGRNEVYLLLVSELAILLAFYASFHWYLLPPQPNSDFLRFNLRQFIGHIVKHQLASAGRFLGLIYHLLCFLFILLFAGCAATFALAWVAEGLAAWSAAAAEIMSARPYLPFLPAVLLLTGLCSVFCSLDYFRLGRIPGMPLLWLFNFTGLTIAGFALFAVFILRAQGILTDASPLLFLAPGILPAVHLVITFKYVRPFVKDSWF